MAASTIDIAPVTPRLGAIVTGVDLAGPPSEDHIAELRAAWLEHQVLFFRDQDLTLGQHRDFAAAFGDLYVHPTIPGPAGFPEALAIRTTAKTKKAAGEGWHTDVSADAEPPSASILRLIEVPPCGGDTLFCSMYAAYDALSDHWKRFIDPLDARHDSTARHGGEFGLEIEQHPVNIHPVVRTHPETGRKALYVNQGFTMSIEGMSSAESRATLDFLFAHCENPAFQVRFSWEANSIAMWDNRCVMHNAVYDYHPHTRRGYRFTVMGERPTR